MVLRPQYQTLFDYTWHTTQRLMDKAAQLSEADYTANPGYGHGSVHDLLFHLLRTLHGWRMGLQSQQAAPLRGEDCPDLASLRTIMEDERLAWQALLATLTDEVIGGEVELINWRGEVFSIPCWRVLQHLALHGMQHHTEIAQLLTLKGHSPGDIDFIFY